MDHSWFVSAAFGAGLFIAGLVMMRSHYKSWQRQKADTDLDEGDLTFFRRRYRRRMQASGLMALIGVLIPIGDSVERFDDAPGFFAVYWIVVLALVLWLILLAAGDLAATKAHSTVALNRIRKQQRQLEREAAALRERLSTRKNGSTSSESKDSESS